MSQLIPHFQGTDVIGEYQFIESPDGVHNNHDVASYRLKDLPDIAKMHLNQGSLCNVISIQIKVEFTAVPVTPPLASFSFDKTWNRDEFVALDLNGIYRVPNTLTDLLEKRAHMVNGLGNNWRQPALITTSPPRPPTHGFISERCQLIFFGEDGYLKDGSLYVATSAPHDKNDLSVSTPGNNLGGGNPRTLTRFQDLLRTSVFIYDSIAGGFDVLNLSNFFALREGYFCGIQESIWTQSGNLEIFGSSDLGPPRIWSGVGTVRVGLKIVRKLLD